MISALVKWCLAPGITPDQAIERFKQSTHYYAGLPGLVRKYIVINREQRFGYGIYLWHDRKTAEAFYECVTPVFSEETGNDPEIEFFDAPIVVDNLGGETLIYGCGVQTKRHCLERRCFNSATDAYLGGPPAS